MTTPAGDPEATLRVDSDVRTPSSRTSDAQFAPGTIIAGRYRIASILGSGGMGEVYRADDVKLDQAVALKFLPARLARDPVLLARLHDEVRLGRQIAHPNVCRIYDIVESDGAHFLAMEYVDGEDLARLLRRIGRLAHDKAIDIARGIAAGLMAAHAKGILHRDLKPANVMVDSRGESRIMDFGLALTAGEHDGTISGTPAYMAPEQLEGRGASVQSDLYALGLVMYELFTGKRAHAAHSMQERVRDTSDITTPSDVVRDIDPAVERIILRCLSNDPAQRPRSAREVIEALPGGDPLAAALAAGETPSPRIVAAAGSEGSLARWQAWSLLAASMACIVITVAGLHRFGTWQYISFEKAPAVLEERARSILRTLDIPEQPFRGEEFHSDRRYVGWIFRTDASPRRWERLRRGPAPVTYAVFESATPDPPREPFQQRGNALRPGTNAIDVDMNGRLVALTVLPRDAWPEKPLDWRPLFAAAGLDPSRFTTVKPTLVPAGATDVHRAWAGRHPDDGTPIQIEAAAWRGRPVFFRITGPWATTSSNVLPFENRNIAIFATVLVLSAIVLGLLLTWRNLRLRRGDRHGAIRVAATIFLLELVAALLLADHYPAGMHEVDVLRRAASEALLWGLVVAVLYLALEPFVRRRWPSQLIASTRLIGGNFRDPMVGRDVLIGILLGLGHIVIIVAGIMLAAASGRGTIAPLQGYLDVLRGARYGFGYLLGALAAGALQGFLMIVVLVTFLMLLRRRWLAAAGLAVTMVIGYVAAVGRVPIGGTILAILFAVMAARYGLLVVMVAQVTFLALFHYALFAGPSLQSIQLLPLVFVVAAALWAFRTSLAGQSPFSASLLDE